jgi:hypothetical protein
MTSFLIMFIICDLISQIVGMNFRLNLKWGIIILIYTLYLIKMKLYWCTCVDGFAFIYYNTLHLHELMTYCYMYLQVLPDCVKSWFKMTQHLMSSVSCQCTLYFNVVGWDWVASGIIVLTNLKSFHVFSHMYLEYIQSNLH